MDGELTRRHLLKLGFGGALAAATVSGSSLRWPERAIADPYPRYAGWVHRKTLVRRGEGPEEGTLWASLIHVGDKLPSSAHRWYLWHWTHDANVCRLYTAPRPTGPFTERTCSIPDPPSGYTVFSAGDVVWEPPYFYSTPHAHAPDSHDTFLLRSRDGRRWRYVTREPILRAGAAGDFDSFAASYARFLRDLHGRMVRLGGKAVLYYRGQHPGLSGERRYGVGAAASSDLVEWTKLTHPARPLFKPLGDSLFMIGTALWQPNAREVNLILSVAKNPVTVEGFERELYPPLYTLELKRALRSNSLRHWADGPGMPLYTSRFLFTDGGYLVVDPTTGTQYMALAAATRRAAGGSVELLQSLVGAEPTEGVRALRP